jgi:fatty acid desaturase
MSSPHLLFDVVVGAVAIAFVVVLAVAIVVVVAAVLVAVGVVVVVAAAAVVVVVVVVVVVLVLVEHDMMEDVKVSEEQKWKMVSWRSECHSSFAFVNLFVSVNLAQNDYHHYSYYYCYSNQKDSYVYYCLCQFPYSFVPFYFVLCLFVHF